MDEKIIKDFLDNLNGLSKTFPKGYAVRLLVLEDNISFLEIQGVELKPEGEK